MIVWIGGGFPWNIWQEILMNQPTEFADSVNLTKKVSPFHPHLQGMLWRHHNCNFIVLIIQDGALKLPHQS